jgi:hypothetical protein
LTYNPAVASAYTQYMGRKQVCGFPWGFGIILLFFIMGFYV